MAGAGMVLSGYLSIYEIRHGTHIALEILRYEAEILAHPGT